MEPVMETIGQAAAELEPAAETVVQSAVDYSEKFDTIILQLTDVINNQNFNGVVLSDLLEKMQLQMEQLGVLKDHMLQLVDFMRYVAGFALFFVIIAILVFSYKFLRMFI